MNAKLVCIFLVINFFCLSERVGASENVVLQLRWDHQFQFAGYYAAKWQGYYEAAGLDVEIRSAIQKDGKILQAVEEVSSGRADFGIGAADILIGNDKGYQLAVTAAIFQQSAARFYAKSGTPLNSPRDLVNLKVARNVNDLIDVELQAMLRSEGIDPKLIQPYPHQPGYQHLLSGAVDVLPGYSISLPFELRQDGISVSQISPYFYGVDFYGDSIFCSRRLISENPELVKQFTQASLKGWEYALEHSDEIAKKISDNLPRTAQVNAFAQFNEFQISGVKDLSHYPIVELGHINPRRWERMHTFLKQIGIVKESLDLDNFIFNPLQIEKRTNEKVRVSLAVAASLLLAFGLISLLFIVMLRKKVTERTAKLAESEERLRLAIASSPIPIMIHDEDDRVIQLSIGWTNLSGYTLEDIPTLGDWTDKAYGERAEVSKKYIDDLFAIGCTVQNGEWHIKAKDGSMLIWEFQTTPLGKVNEGKRVLLSMATDITERKQAEKALAASEKQYRMLVETANEGIWAMDGNHFTTYVNMAMAKMLGYQPGEMIGKKVEDFFFPEDMSFHKEKMAKRHAGGDEVYDRRFRRRDGSELWTTVSAKALLDDKGYFAGSFAMFTDTTERKRTEEALRQTEQRLRLANKATNDVIWDWDVVTDTQRWNETGTIVFGWTEIVEHSVSANWWIERVHPDDKQRVHDSFFAVVGNPLSDVWHDEYRFLKADGSYADVFDRGYVQRNEQGRAIRMVGAMLDITDRKRTEAALRQSEETYRALVDGLPDIVMRFDQEGRHLFVSENVREIVGIEAERFVGKTHSELGFPEEQCRFWEKSIRQVFDNGAPSENEFMYEGKTGPLFFNWRLIPERDEHGAVSSVLSISRNISERKKAEVERDKLQAQLQQAQKLEAIGTLAGGIAHDFNNILGAIVGYTEIISEDLPPGSPSSHDINQVLKASHRAKDLVKQILAFSRQVDDQKIPMQPAGIVKEAITLLRSSLPTTITIQQNIDPDAGMVLADPTQVHQIVMNLATNAFHAMEAKGGTLTICVEKKILSQEDLAKEPDLQPGAFVQLLIKDTGPGIPLDIRDRIFDPFFTTKEVGKGTGLGLSMVYSIVKSSNGSITYNSRVGEGTEFCILLPVLEGHAEEEGQSTDLIPLGKEHILLIDDEEILVELGQTMLNRLGYSVTTRTSSLDALATFQNQPNAFDLVITDQTMPGMTGVDLARRMQQIRPNLPIILCTGYSSQITEDKAKAAGIRGFAYKPLAKKEIGEMIRKVLDEKSL